jgi:uncharacterized protein
MTTNPAINAPLIRQPFLRVAVFCITYLLVFFLTGYLYVWINAFTQVSEKALFIYSFIISFLCSMLTVYVFRKFIDRRSFRSLGFAWKTYQRDAAVGLLLSVALLGIQSLILHVGGNLVWTGVIFDGEGLISGLLIMILVAIGEEAVFRGYILHNLAFSTNRWVALVISALLFSLFHSLNPNITVLAMVNIFLAGLVMGINYLYTGNLWFGIMFHLGWNFVLGPILGSAVSGLPLTSLLQQEVSGPEWFTGGAFGLEGSVLDGIFSIISLAVLLLVYQKHYGAKVATGQA